MDKKEKEKKPSFFDEAGRFMKPYRAAYAASVIISILSVIAGMGVYIYVAKTARALFLTDAEWEKIFIYAFCAVVLKIMNVILLNMSTWFSHNAAYRTLRDMRLAVSEKMLRLPVGYFEKSGSGRLKTMMADNIENMEKTLAHMLPELTANSLAPLLIALFMFITDWRIALIVFVWMAAGLSVTGGMMKGYEEKYRGQIKAAKAMNQSVAEYVNGIEVIKNFGRVDECYKKYHDNVYGHAEYNVGWQKETQKYMSLGMAIAPFTVFPVIISGLIFYGSGSIDAGDIFLMVILSFGIFGPIMNISGYFDQLAGMGTDAKEINDVLCYPELKRGSVTRVENYDIDYKNVSFSYDGTKKAIDDINLHIKQGSSLALVGPSGSGKSTIAKLLAGYWDVSGGEIDIGGIPLEEMPQEYLNDIIAYVDQETFLFDDTIENNIKLSCPGASHEDVVRAASEAGCDAFIRALPDGYDTLAGEGGKRLSGGERQRIAIVRAMMKKAPIMILDEATSSTDPENEASIQRALSTAAEGKTLVVVAHRLATVMDLDRIAFVKDGKIISTGDHETLLRTCPEYEKMWKLGGGAVK